jgi:hypothetical protein
MSALFEVFTLSFQSLGQILLGAQLLGQPGRVQHGALGSLVGAVSLGCGLIEIRLKKAKI